MDSRCLEPDDKYCGDFLLVMDCLTSDFLFSQEKQAPTQLNRFFLGLCYMHLNAILSDTAYLETRGLVYKICVLRWGW